MEDITIPYVNPYSGLPAIMDITSPMFVPKKHKYCTYGAQQRAAKQRRRRRRKEGKR
jgi:hypothetical protein